MTKRKTPKEVIESEDSKVEHAYAKFPRRRLIPTTKRSTEGSVWTDPKKIRKLMEKGNYKDYIEVHTHTNSKGGIFDALPSRRDLRSFVKNQRKRGIVIAQRDKRRGELMGYAFLMKRKGHANLTKRYTNDLIEDYGDYLKADISSENFKAGYEDVERVTRYGKLWLRFFPAKGYYFNKDISNFQKSRHNLESAVASILIGFVLLVLLANIPITGAVISNSVSNINAGLFLIEGFLFSLIAYFVLIQVKRIIRA